MYTDKDSNLISDLGIYVLFIFLEESEALAQVTWSFQLPAMATFGREVTQHVNKENGLE